MQAMKKTETAPPSLKIGISMLNKEHDEILDRVIAIVVMSLAQVQVQ